jgi:hypothetical protein
MDHPTYGWVTFTFDGNGWSGLNTPNLGINTAAGSCYFEDIDGELYCGIVGTKTGFGIVDIHKTGYRTDMLTHDNFNDRFLSLMRHK